MVTAHLHDNRYGRGTMTVLGAPEAYQLWAATSFQETGLADELTPPLSGLRLLDAGCGTGRRLRDLGAASAVGVDISPEMLAEGALQDPSITTMVAEIRALPLPNGGFDVIWCRLVIGHLPDSATVYREIAHMAEAGARLVVTDFHAAAYEAGHRRSFRHDGEVHEIEHYVHTPARHQQAAEDAGWRLVTRREAAIGPAARPFYEQAGRPALYDAHEGLPVVLGLVLFFARGLTR